MSTGKGYTPEQSRMIDFLAEEARKRIAAGENRAEVIAALSAGFHGQEWVTIYNGISEILDS